MYACTLKRVSKQQNLDKRVCFSTLKIVMCLGYKTHSRDQNKKGNALLTCLG